MSAHCLHVLDQLKLFFGSPAVSGGSEIRVYKTDIKPKVLKNPALGRDGKISGFDEAFVFL